MPYAQPGYRPGASKYNGGFQRPKTGQSPWKPSGPPANDNVPRYGTGTPANDNAPARKGNAKPGSSKPASSYPGKYGKGLSKALPWLAAGYAAYELWQWYNGAHSPVDYVADFVSPPGYSPYRVNCWVGNPPHNRNSWGWKNGVTTNDPVCSAGVFGKMTYDGQGFAEGKFYVGYATKSNINTTWIPYSWTKTGTHNTGTRIAGDYGAWTFPSPVGPRIPAVPPMPSLPQIYPELDPGALPIKPAWPMPWPRPLPVRFPGRPDQDPISPTSPRRLKPNNRPRPRPRYANRPSVRPATVTQITPDSVATGEGGHPMRPRPNEKKLILNPHAASAVGIAIATASEAGDLIEAFHDALPDRCQRHQPGQFFDAIAVANCWDHLDHRQALKNLVANEIDDRIYGKVGRRQARANRETGRPRSNPRIGPARGELPSIGEAVADFLFGA